MMIMMVMMMGFGLIVPLLLVGVVAFALVRRQQFNQTGQADTSQTSAKILNTRYANGEITREEYEQVRQDLEG